MVYEIVKTAYKNKNINSVIIGSPKSFVVDRLRKEKIPFQFFCQKTSTACENKLQSDNDLIVHFHNSDDLYKFRKIKGRCVVWGILAPQITEWNRFSFESKYTGKKRVGDFLTRRLLRHLRDKDSVISMDGATSNALNRFVGVENYWPIIPIPIDSTDARTPSKKLVKRKGLVLSYVGRSDDIWKLKPAKKIVKDLSKLIDIDFQINIYTDQARPYVEEFRSVSCSNIDLKFHHGLYGPALRSHLNAHSDVHFSMGTAALEGGLAGIPTILVDPCECDMPENYKYRWLFQTERNSLGRFVGSEETDFPGMEMREVIESCGDENRRIGLADLSQACVLENHSTIVVLDKLLSHPAKATMQDICRLTPAAWAIRPYVSKVLKMIN